MRHPADLGAQEATAFLSHLSNEMSVSASTQRQAASAIAFLYQDVLGRAIELPRAVRMSRGTKRVPRALAEEVRVLLARLEGTRALVAAALYKAGLRLMEGMRLRIKDVDPRRQGRAVQTGADCAS